LANYQIRLKFRLEHGWTRPDSKTYHDL